jgi:hypothetical protein
LGIRADIKATVAKRRAAKRELQTLTPQAMEDRLAGLDLDRVCLDFRRAVKNATPSKSARFWRRG